MGRFRKLQEQQPNPNAAFLQGGKHGYLHFIYQHHHAMGFLSRKRENARAAGFEASNETGELLVKRLVYRPGSFTIFGERQFGIWSARGSLRE
jgi:hypothetical protein